MATMAYTRDAILLRLDSLLTPRKDGGPAAGSVESAPDGEQRHRVPCPMCGSTMGLNDCICDGCAEVQQQRGERWVRRCIG